MEKKGSERACQPSLSILHLGLALLTGAVLVEVFFIHHLYQEVSLIKTELAVRAVGTSDRPNEPSSDGLARGDIGRYRLRCIAPDAIAMSESIMYTYPSNVEPPNARGLATTVYCLIHRH